MKLVLAGSPHIAVPAFEKIINHFKVVAIITQPDRPRGRGLHVQETPVAALAKKYNILLFKTPEISTIQKKIEQISFDLLLTFAFGQYIPSSILALGKYKPLNIHGSLLPKYRGAAPVHHAILNGDKEIGITLIEMTSQMDAGDMLFRAKQKIGPNTNTSQGFEIISLLAAQHIVPWLIKIKNNQVHPIKQGPHFSLAPKVNKSHGELQLTWTKEDALCKIRGLNDYPGTFIFINNRRLKVFKASSNFIKDAIKIYFANGPLFIWDYQWENKKRQNILSA